VQHGGTRVGAQHRGREHRRRRTAAQTAAGLVDDEHPVGVAVERQTEVEPAGHDAGLEVALVGRLQRVGGVVGERAVEVAVHQFQGDLRDPPEHRWDDESTHAVGGVGDDP
jgi:hypothetical protein